MEILGLQVHYKGKPNMTGIVTREFHIQQVVTNEKTGQQELVNEPYCAVVWDDITNPAFSYHSPEELVHQGFAQRAEDDDDYEEDEEDEEVEEVEDEREVEVVNP